MAWDLKERRYSDRVRIPSTAHFFADDDHGNRLGRVRILGRGGFLLETNRRFPAFETLDVILIAERDGIRRMVNVMQRYTSPDGHVGFEFQDLDPRGAVEFGALMVKYAGFSGEDK